MTRRLVASSFAVGLAAFVACSGEDRGRPSSERPDAGSQMGEPCEADDGYAFKIITDFEITTATGALQCDPGVFVPTQDAPTCMFLNYDRNHSLGGLDCEPTDAPDRLADVVSPGIERGLGGTPIEGGRCGSPGNGMHVLATDIATCYGSNGRRGWGISVEVLVSTSAELGVTGEGGAGGAGSGVAGAGGAESVRPGLNGFDASMYDGISFWTRKGGGDTGDAIIVTVSDPATAGDPYCSTLENALDAQKCDAFGVAVTLTDDWTFVAAPFAAMQQKGFGVPSPFVQIDNGNIVRLNFLASAGNWDFWIDDVAFYRGPR
jgi:hypothetical protein